MNLQKKCISTKKILGNKTISDKSLIRLQKSPGIMISAFGVSSSHKKKSFLNTSFLSSDPTELCDRLKFLLQKKLETILL